MIEPVGAFPLVSQVQNGATAQGSITPADIETFENALREAGGAGLPPVSIRTAEPVGPETSLIDVIGQTIDLIRTSTREQVGRIQDLTVNGGAGNGTMELRDLLSLQFELMKLSLQQDFTTKVADKLSQGAQTLFRNQ